MTDDRLTPDERGRSRAISFVVGWIARTVVFTAPPVPSDPRVAIVAILETDGVKCTS